MTGYERDRHWSLESLTKAYRQGYMAGLAGNAQDSQPFDASVPAAAWEAGWVDGDGQRCLGEARRLHDDPGNAKKRA